MNISLPKLRKIVSEHKMKNYAKYKKEDLAQILDIILPESDDGRITRCQFTKVNTIPIPITMTKRDPNLPDWNDTLIFPSIYRASKEIRVSPITISLARKGGKLVNGWIVS